MDKRILELEERLAYQDAAIDELTAQSVRQQRLINELIGHVEKLQTQVRQLAENGAGEVPEAPPPHY